MAGNDHSAQVVANFDAEASRWEQNYAGAGGMTPRLDRFALALDQVPRSAQILDFGCGTGAVGRALSERGWTVSGADVSPKMLAEARRARPDLSWVPIPDDGVLPFADGMFAAVVASSVFEYLAEPDRALREISRVLAPGGLLLITVPDPRHPARRKERPRQMLARLPLMPWLLGETRWGGYLRYLRLSINRPPLETWRQQLSAAGLRPEPAPACSDPLALLVARRG